MKTGSAAFRFRSTESARYRQHPAISRAPLASYQSSLAVRKRLAESEPGNADRQRDLATSQELIGRILQAQGNLTEALGFHESSVAIRERLAKADPDNADWQGALSESLNNVGNVLEAQGNLPEALKFYQASVTIADRLLNAHPDDIPWQRNLAM